MAHFGVRSLSFYTFFAECNQCMPNDTNITSPTHPIAHSHRIGAKYHGSRLARLGDAHPWTSLASYAPAQDVSPEPLGVTENAGVENAAPA